MRPGVNNYKDDKYYPRIVGAVSRIIETTPIVSPVEVMIEMGNLHRNDFQKWKRGQTPYLV